MPSPVASHSWWQTCAAASYSLGTRLCAYWTPSPGATPPPRHGCACSRCPPIPDPAHAESHRAPSTPAPRIWAAQSHESRLTGPRPAPETAFPFLSPSRPSRPSPKNVLITPRTTCRHARVQRQAPGLLGQNTAERTLRAERPRRSATRRHATKSTKYLAFDAYPRWGWQEARACRFVARAGHRGNRCRSLPFDTETMLSCKHKCAITVDQGSPQSSAIVALPGFDITTHHALPPWLHKYDLPAPVPSPEYSERICIHYKLVQHRS